MAAKRYKTKFLVPAPPGKNVREWRDPCGRSIRLELGAGEVIQSVTVSEIAPREPSCGERKMEPLNQNSWITGRGLQLGDPEEIVYDLYGEPKSSGPSEKGQHKLEFMLYTFDWAGSDVPQRMEVLCERETGRVVEITLARQSR